MPSDKAEPKKTKFIIVGGPHKIDRNDYLQIGDEVELTEKEKKELDPLNEKFLLPAEFEEVKRAAKALAALKAAQSDKEMARLEEIIRRFPADLLVDKPAPAPAAPPAKK